MTREFGDGPLFFTPRFLRPASYVHSTVYAALLYAAIAGDRGVVAVLGWVHGIGWIVMSLLCLAAVRRRTIPLWLGVMVAIIGGVGPFVGSIGFYRFKRRPSGPSPGAPATAPARPSRSG